MASGLTAGDGFFRGVGLEGCITSGDMEITRRPYHHNCNCALHKTRGKCLHIAPLTNVSYAIRRVWSEGSLALLVSTNGYSSCSSPVAGTMTGISRSGKSSFDLCEEEQQF